MIASSPTDIQPVLDVVAENAARLCDATDAQIYRVEGEAIGLSPSTGHAIAQRDVNRPVIRGLAPGRYDGPTKLLHVHDISVRSQN